MHHRRLIALLSYVFAMFAVGSAPGAAAQGFPDPLGHDDDRLVRIGKDGGGPSHLIVSGDYLLVVDPRDRVIHRYSRSNLNAPEASCRLPVEPGMWPIFSPWRTVQSGSTVRLVGEPYGPNDQIDYAYLARRTMVIDPAQVAAMGQGGSCAFSIVNYDAKLDAPLSFSWTTFLFLDQE